MLESAFDSSLETLSALDSVTVVVSVVTSAVVASVVASVVVSVTVVTLVSLEVTASSALTVVEAITPTDEIVSPT